MRFDLCNSNFFFPRNLVGSRAVEDSLMFQNRSSLAESAHVNTEAAVSGHYLDSSCKSMQKVSKRGNFSKSGRNWELEYFCEMGMNLRLRQNLELS